MPPSGCIVVAGCHCTQSRASVNADFDIRIRLPGAPVAITLTCLLASQQGMRAGHTWRRTTHSCLGSTCCFGTASESSRSRSQGTTRARREQALLRPRSGAKSCATAQDTAACGVKSSGTCPVRHRKARGEHTCTHVGCQSPVTALTVAALPTTQHTASRPAHACHVVKWSLPARRLFRKMAANPAAISTVATSCTSTCRCTCATLRRQGGKGDTDQGQAA